MIVRRLGRVRGEPLRWLREWAAAQELERATRSSYAPGRRERWFRLAVHLGSGQATECEDPLPRLVALGDRLLPGWRSLLLAGADTTIGAHRDAAAFEADAAMVNLGEAECRWWASQRDDGYPSRVELADGDVALLNVKVLHAATPRSEPRWSLTFRRVRPATLPLPLP